MTKDTRFIDGDWRRKCVEALTGDSFEVFAPVSDGSLTRFGPCQSAGDMLRDHINTDGPVKEVFFPRTETLLTYRLAKGADEASKTPDITPRKIAVRGGHPCDAASLDVLDTIFNWDYEDAFYNARRRDSLILTVGCARADDNCFCTTLGLAPDATEGSDWLIQEAGEAGAVVTVVAIRMRDQ